MKKYKNILCCALALALMVGIVVPLVQFSAQASEYTLTVLNPMGTIVPHNNIPLADRQPLIDKLEAGGEQGNVKVLLLNYDKNGDQFQLWAIAFMLQELWEEQYPGTKVDIVPVDPPGGVQTWGVVPAGWDWYTAGRVPWLGTPWGPKTGMNHIDGMTLSEEPFARYQFWANNFDFVLYGEQN